MSDYDSSLPIRTQNAGDAVVKVCDATVTSQQLGVLSTGEAKVAVTQPIAAGTNNIGQVSIQDSSGAPFSPANPLPVYMQDSPGTEVNSYNTVASLAAGGTSNQDYTVTALKTLALSSVIAAGSGKMKIEVQVETGVATGIFTSYFVQFNSTANPNMQVVLTEQIRVAAGVRVRVIRTNKDNQAQDVYSTICGHEF